MTDTASTPVAKVSTTAPDAAASPTLVKVLQTRATTPRLLKIIENHTAALEPQSVTIHSVSQTSITLSFWGVAPSEKGKSHVGASEPREQFATIPFASELPADPTSPTVKFDDEFVGEMVSRIVTLSSIPPTGQKGKKISIKVERYLGPDSFISVVSIAYYCLLSLVIISWLGRDQILRQLGMYTPLPAPEGMQAPSGTTAEAGILGSGAPKTGLPAELTLEEQIKKFIKIYYTFLGTRLFSTDFKFKMIGAMHGWVAMGRMGALLGMRSKLQTYKVTNWGTWLAWMMTAGVEGRPCIDRFQDEVRRLWIEGMEKDKKEE